MWSARATHGVFKGHADAIAYERGCVTPIPYYRRWMRQQQRQLSPSYSSTPRRHLSHTYIHTGKVQLVGFDTWHFSRARRRRSSRPRKLFILTYSSREREREREMKARGGKEAFLALFKEGFSALKMLLLSLSLSFSVACVRVEDAPRSLLNRSPSMHFVVMNVWKHRARTLHIFSAR